VSFKHLKELQKVSYFIKNNLAKVKQGMTFEKSFIVTNNFESSYFNGSK